MKINKQRAKDMYSAGVSYAEIAREFGVSRQAVQKMFGPKPKPIRCVYPGLTNTMSKKHMTFAQLKANTLLGNDRIEGILSGEIYPNDVDRLAIEFVVGEKVDWKRVDILN